MLDVMAFIGYYGIFFCVMCLLITYFVGEEEEEE